MSSWFKEKKPRSFVDCPNEALSMTRERLLALSSHRMNSDRKVCVLAVHADDRQRVDFARLVGRCGVDRSVVSAQSRHTSRFSLYFQTAVVEDLSCLYFDAVLAFFGKRCSATSGVCIDWFRLQWVPSIVWLPSEIGANRTDLKLGQIRTANPITDGLADVMRKSKKARRKDAVDSERSIERELARLP